MEAFFYFYFLFLFLFYFILSKGVQAPSEKVAAILAALHPKRLVEAAAQRVRRPHVFAQETVPAGGRFLVLGWNGCGHPRAAPRVPAGPGEGRPEVRPTTSRPGVLGHTQVPSRSKRNDPARCSTMKYWS